jgi:hypothetical protein
MRVPSKLLVFGRTTIRFCFCRQVDWQEYSEFRKSALLVLSASAIGKNGQLGICSIPLTEYRLDVVSTRLSAAEQFEAATEAARRGLGGGKVYDLLTSSAR